MIRPRHAGASRRRAWRVIVTVVAVLAATVLAALIYSVHMPGKTHRGPLMPLGAEEARIRDHLAAHVETLAGRIGERNLWHYPALLAAADYIQGTLT
ncbi:MAG: hypothetical protein WAK53_02530, partial [Chromatiaceae bacterium]